jgi:hypothetical protein
MHTFDWTDPETGKEAHIHHNGDFSGTAVINIPKEMLGGDVLPAVTDMEKPTWLQGRVEVHLPARMLAELSRTAVIHEMIGKIEEWM